MFPTVLLAAEAFWTRLLRLDAALVMVAWERLVDPTGVVSMATALAMVSAVVTPRQERAATSCETAERALVRNVAAEEVEARVVLTVTREAWKVTSRAEEKALSDMLEWMELRIEVSFCDVAAREAGLTVIPWVTVVETAPRLS